MRASKDQAAMVTGATSGIGRALALGLAAQGAGLCLVGRRRESLEQVADEARVAGAGMAVSCVADLAVDEDLDGLVRRATRELGRCDVLVHAAGTISLAPIAEAGLEDLDRHYRTNLRAPAALTRALLPALRAASGQIAFINSTAVLRAAPNTGHYAATKHGLKGLADALREEVNGDGVRVLSVFVGRTATPMQAAIHEREGRPYRPDQLLQPEDVAAVVIHALSLPRTAEVTEITIRPLRKPS
jgi:NADP-dependent 3-hydroxy acid dehydrogenase YdfG